MDSEEVLFQFGGWEKGYLNHKKNTLQHYNILHKFSDFNVFEMTFATENGHGIWIL